MRIEQDHPNVLIYYWPKVGADEVCGVARGIFHHVWAFHTAFVGPCTEPLELLCWAKRRRLAWWMWPPSCPDLLHRVPKSKQQRLTERLLIHTVLSCLVTLLFKVFPVFYGTGVLSPCSPKSDTLLYVAGASDVRSTSSQLTGIHSHIPVTDPKRHLWMKSSDQNFVRNSALSS